MSRITMPPYEALAQLIAECKQLDASEVGERWNQFNGAIAVAEMVLRDYVEPAPVAWASFADNGNIRIWSKEPLVTFGFKTQPLYAEPVAAQPAAAPASDDLREGRTMLDDLIASITKHGNYSQESTLAFLNQLRQCLAAPLNESGSAAAVRPIVRLMHVDEPGGAKTSPPVFDIIVLDRSQCKDGLELYAAAPAIAAPTEVERDAKRYRWLRECDWFSSELCVLRNPKKALTSGAGLGADCPSLTRLDDFIDAAIATGEKK